MYSSTGLALEGPVQDLYLDLMYSTVPGTIL